MRHPDYADIDPLHGLAMRMWYNWNALVARPPSRVRGKTYDRFMRFFSAHWPEGAPWPSDIPRPTRTQEVPR